MPAADPIQICPNPFYDEQGDMHVPMHVHQLAQIHLADGSLVEAYYNSESKKVIIERNNVYYECLQDLTMMNTFDAIIGLNEERQLSDESWAEIGEIRDTILFTSWKHLRRRHRALQLVFV